MLSHECAFQQLLSCLIFWVHELLFQLRYSPVLLFTGLQVFLRLIYPLLFHWLGLFQRFVFTEMACRSSVGDCIGGRSQVKETHTFTTLAYKTTQIPVLPIKEKHNYDINNPCLQDHTDGRSPVNAATITIPAYQTAQMADSSSGRHMQRQ